MKNGIFIGAGIGLFVLIGNCNHLIHATPTKSQPIRGVIEGFYGKPWTNAERVSMFYFMKTEHLNTYVYAPKDDPYQRAKWNVLYPNARLKAMRTLVSSAKANDIRFVYSISPGIPAPLPGGKLTPQMISSSITYSSVADRKQLEAKMEQLESIGVHTFMLSFDDIETMLKPPDRQTYGKQYATAQMQLVNQVRHDEIKHDPKFQLWFAPTSYYGLTDRPYWRTLRSTLNPAIQVIWTGKWVINRTITTAQAEKIAKLYGRKPILWDNYPVNDYTYVANKPHRLMMGPLKGRDATLLQHVAGYIANPMLQPEASKLALQTISDYLQNPHTYRPILAWNQALKEMPGITNPDLFKSFAEYATRSVLNANGYDPVRSLANAYWHATTAEQKRVVENKLSEQFKRLDDLPKSLPPTVTDDVLQSEITPWLTKLGQEGQGGLDAIAELNRPSRENEQALQRQLNGINHSPYEIGRSIVTFMRQVEEHHQ